MKSDAVFNFLLLPTPSQGIPGKNLSVKIMAMSSLIKRGICQKDLSFKGQKTLAQSDLNGEWNMGTIRAWRCHLPRCLPFCSAAWHQFCFKLFSLGSKVVRAFPNEQPETKQC